MTVCVKKRDEIIDILKAIGIIFMVCGHSGAPFKNFIYLFHMAIFFMASGYFFSSKKSATYNSVKIFIKKRVKALWFPYFLWISVFTLLHNFFIKINIYTDNPMFLELLDGEYIKLTLYYSEIDIFKNILKAFLFYGGEQIVGAFWFIACLFKISVLYCIIDYIIHYLEIDEKSILKYQGIIAIVFLGIGYIFKIFHINFWGLGIVLSCYILFYIGFFLKAKCISSKKYSTKVHVFIFAICYCSLYILNMFGSIELAINKYPNPLFLIVSSLLGWQFLYEISWYINQFDGLIKRLFILIGNNTMSVIIFHFICFKLVNCLGCVIYNKPTFLIAAFPILFSDSYKWFLAYVLVGICIPVFISVIYKKIQPIILEKVILKEEKYL